MAWDCYCNSKFSFPGPRTKLLPTVWYDSLQSHPTLLCLLVRLEVPQNWAGICCCFHTKFSALLILCGSYSEFFVPQQQLEIFKLARRISSILFLLKTSLKQSKVVFELKWEISDHLCPCTHFLPPQHAAHGKKIGKIWSLLEVFFLSISKGRITATSSRKKPYKLMQICFNP